MSTLFSRERLGRHAAIAAIAAIWSFCGSAIQAKPLGNATVTQVNNDVRFKPGAGNERAAKPKDVVKGSDTLRTGQKSQAEIEFEDRTITRLGSNSTFTFDPEKREFQLKKGLLLFDMPKGAGGGKIITPAGTAAIEGTAGIVSYRSAPKIICLAGIINVLDPNGKMLAKVMPGQLFIVGVTKHPVDFMLNGVKGGKLMNGGLPNNKQEFDNSNTSQLNQLQTGVLQATPFVMLGEKTEVFVAQPATGNNPSDKAPEVKPTPPPPAQTFTIGSDTTMDGGTALITGSGGSMQGTMQNGKAIFDFGAKNVTVSGNPTATPGPSGSFNADFVTQGTLAFNDMPPDTSQNGPGSHGDVLAFKASSISIANSLFKIGGDTETAPSSMSFYADGNLMVDPSTLRVHSGPADGSSNPAGLIHLESANGLVTFVGNGYDPVNDPTDSLRSHAQATVKVDAYTYNGGDVEFVSKGTRTLLIGDYLYPYDGVSIHDATIDVSPKDDGGYVTYGKGGNVRLNGKMQVLIEDTVDINATGSTPGTVTIQSGGNDVLSGLITLKVPNSTGHIRLDAQTTTSSFGDGTINLNGIYQGGTYNINLLASGPLGGGTIALTAFGNYYSVNLSETLGGNGGISIQGARLDASAASRSGLPAGTISLQAPEITLNNAKLSAGDFFSTYYHDGTVGQIKVSAVNPNGTYLGSQVSIANSTLTVGGAADSSRGIFITGDKVTIDSTSIDNFSTDPAQVHIQSRENTGGWSTDSAASIYWTPLYYVMDNSTTIDLSGATPQIAQGTRTADSFNGTINANNVAVFDYGSQNILLWPNSPHSKPNATGLFEAEFRTCGSFEAFDAIPSGGTGNTPSETSHISIYASGIQIINSTFDMGDSGALNGPSSFQLYSTTDAIAISPTDPNNESAHATVFAPKPGIVNEQSTGGKFHMESAGVTALMGGDASQRLTKVLVGAADVGGIVEIISTGIGAGSGGSAEGVHIRNALIDASRAIISDYPSYSLSSMPASQGGKVTLDGLMQVAIRDTADISADGYTPGSIQVTSSGDGVTPGQIVLRVDDISTPGHVFLSATSYPMGTPNPGDIVVYGSTLEDGITTVNLNASSGTIEVEAPKNIRIISASLDASALPNTTLSGGTIRLLAGASPDTLTDSSATLQLLAGNLLARGFDGGEVTTIPTGTPPFYLPADLDVRDSLIDVSSTGGTSAGKTPRGGDVYLQGTLTATITADGSGSTTINADGPAAGTGTGSAGSIQIQSPGTDSTPGNVTVVDVDSNKTHYIRLSAQDSAAVFNALANGGNIDIHGADGRASGNENIQIVASGPAGGGTITMSTVQNLSVINAQLNANGAGSLPGGSINLSAQNIYILNSLLTASSASGPAGQITISGNISASILNSILQTLGSTGGGITISSPTVNLAGTTLKPGPSGTAQIYANTFTAPASGSYVLHQFNLP